MTTLRSSYDHVLVSAVQQLAATGSPWTTGTLAGYLYAQCTKRIAADEDAALAEWIRQHPELGVAVWFDGVKTMCFSTPVAVRQHAVANTKHTRFAI